MLTVAGFNTSHDRLVAVDALLPGQVQRGRLLASEMGGKGLHVARAAATLGAAVALVGLVESDQHASLRNQLAEIGVQFAGVGCAEPLRQCLAIRDGDGRVTELLEDGPLLSPAVAEQLLQQTRLHMADSTDLALSGSLPRGLPIDTYASLSAEARRAGLRCAVDASGAVLRAVVAAGADIIKPNRDELQALLNIRLASVAEAARAAADLRAAGIALPLLSLGADGAVLACAEGIWHAVCAPLPIANPVGSGDCMLAGMVVALRQGDSPAAALAHAVACGSANAMHPQSGHIDRALLTEVTAKVRLTRLD